MGQDDAAFGGSRAGNAREFMNEKFAGQSMKAVALHAPGIIAPGNRQQTGHARHVVMKGGVETRELRQGGKAPMKGFRQKNLFRQMFGIERAELMQFRDHFRSNGLRLPISGTAVDHAMADCGQFTALNPVANPVHQHIHGRCVIRRNDWARKIIGIVWSFYREAAVRSSDAFNPACQDSWQPVPGLKQGKFDARRASIDGQNRFSA